MKFSRSLVWASSKSRTRAARASMSRLFPEILQAEAQGQICSSGRMNGNGQNKQWHHNLVSFVDMAFNLNHIFYIF